LKLKKSAGELRSLETIITIGMLIALSLALRSLAIPIGDSVRITFIFLPIMVVAALYGVVGAAAAAFMTDFFGYVLFDIKKFPYSPLLGLTQILAGIIYGTFLYGKLTGGLKRSGIRLVISRVAVVLVCDVVLNSLIIYKSFVSSIGESGWGAFFVWASPRLGKSAVMLPIDSLLILMTIPAVLAAYERLRMPKENRRR